jgi:hypothetical protein
MQVPRHSYTYDHVLPKSRGGKTNWENIVTACGPCNGRKKNMTPSEAGMKLRVKPHKPDYLPDEFKGGLRWRKSMPEDWKVWFKAEYWHGGVEESPDEIAS